MGGGGKGDGGAFQRRDESTMEVIGQFVGNIKSFNPQKGFGFIECDGLKAAGYTNDVYLHHTKVGSLYKVGNFQAGAQVMFTAFLNARGQPQARDLQDATF